MFDGGFLVEGRVYEVAAFGNIQHGPSIKLVGQPMRHSASGRTGAYAVWRFRPIYRPKADLIESLKQPKCAPIKEPA